GTNFAGATITINHNLGFVPTQIAYKIVPGDWNILTSGSPNILAWTDVLVSFTLDAKADGDVVVVLPQDAGQTLPVELSSFTAVLTADMFVNIAWVSESETNHSGYNVLRSLTRDLDTAVRINSALIDEGTANGTQMSYLFTDKDVYNNNVYYYWLEIVALNGNTEYAGPINVTLGQPGTEPEVPEIPMATKLLNAYPNPFNPQTNIRYSLKDAGQVQIEIFNLKGQKIRSFSNNHATAGFYSQMWDGKDTQGQVVGSGIYFYRMTSGKYSSTKKVMMMK
ncbi:MAG: T9SS type A sorting domain-containing protein, partial [Candidatus Cloacimonetes bacterium]|nr:T9SS type A sorting domain-containing protein [Candidatus Cloacimonadota bacterium]